MVQYVVRLLKCSVFAVFSLIALGPGSADAQQGTHPNIYAPFDASRLSYDERRLLQLALALQGDYNGMLDGDWGWMSQRAMRTYSAREVGDAPTVWHIALLAGEFFDDFERSGWGITYLENFRVSIVFPANAYREEPPSGAYTNWAHLFSSLRISMARTRAVPMLEAHEYILEQAEAGSEPYTVRGRDRFITRVFDGTGFRYARSERISGLWTTVILYVSREDEPILNAVSSGISPMRMRPIYIPEAGYLESTLMAVAAVVDGTPPTGGRPERGPSPVIPPRNPPSTGVPSEPDGEQTPFLSSGTAFMLNDDGFLMTNAHVVDGCQRITVSGRSSSLVGESEQFDLAVLLAPDLAGQSNLNFAPNPAELNESIVAAGYPLQDILGGVNVTQGSVTSMTGLRGDGIHFQMSAPIQPGSSGGPVVDEYGNVVGVVVAFLGADMSDSSRPNIPQNVNFAVRAEIAQLLLTQKSVDYLIGEEHQALEPVELGSLVSGATHAVRCER